MQQGERFIDVSWDHGNSSKYVADIQIIANDRSGLIMEVANIVSNMKISMHAINGRLLKDGLASVMITVEVGDKSDIDKFLKIYGKSAELLRL